MRLTPTASSQQASVANTSWPRPRLSYQVTGLLVAAFDALVITACSCFGQLLANSLNVGEQDLGQSMGIGLMSSVLYISFARASKMYSLQALVRPFHCLLQVVLCCCMVILSVTGILFLLKTGSAFSRASLLSFATAMIALCVINRIVAASLIGRLMHHNAFMGRASFIIGDADELASLSPMGLMRQFGLKEVGRYTLQNAGSAAGDYDAQIGEALTFARQAQTKEMVLVTNGRSIEDLRKIEQALRRTPLPVMLLPNEFYRSALERDELGNHWGRRSIELQRAPLSKSEQAAKRMLDIAVGGFALALFMPILMIAACAIKLETPGPIIFRQRRMGFNDVTFAIYKFRTMTVLEEGDRVVQATQRDRRVTRVGAFLRKSSIDELPQLLNVLRGEMALVGPRPHAIAHDQEYRSIIGAYFKRHHVKPGMTGWAQVHGARGETARPSDMQRRIDYDLWYIDNWSLLLEIWILFRTAFALFRVKAY